MKLTCRSLSAAGALAMTSAIMTIPLFLLSGSAGDGGGQSPLDIAVTVTGTVIGISLLLYLRAFLGRGFRFRACHRFLDLQIGASAAAAALTLALPHIPAREAAGDLLLVLVIAGGIFQALFGVKLLALDDDLHRLRTPFATLSIVTGIAVATVVLVPAAVLTSAISDVMLATIFLQSRKDLPKNR